MQELELLAADALRSAGAGSSPPHPVELAERLMGQGCVRVGEMSPPGGAALARVGGRWITWIDLSGTRQIRRWRVFHELGEWLLIQAGMFDAPAQEAKSDSLASMLRVPRGALLRSLGDREPNWSDLARPFYASETSVALRFGEVIGDPLCVAGPQVRVRSVRLLDDPARLALRVVG